MPDTGAAAATAHSVNVDDPLEDFARRDITLNEVTKRVYVAGKGPAVIVMTEMPGISVITITAGPSPAT